MKCAIAVAVVAALVAVTYGAPVTTAVDWTAVEGKVNQVESSVQSAVQQVNAAAKRDNPTVGADIERKLQVRALEARAVLDQARAAISGRSLTETAAREHFARLRTILENAQNDIRADVAKLSTAVQGQIRDILASNLVDAERLANEIYALLRAAATFAVDWTAVERNVNQVEASVQSAVQNVNAAAKRDNPTVGADIERKLGARAIEARAVLDQARAAISGRSLTETAAREHFARLRTILENAQNDIRADVAKLSTAVQGQIRDILATNLVDAERLANEIYALLREAATFAVDWTAVEAKVNQVESSVQSAVQQVNAAAKRDNPTVGADIERKLQVRALEARAVLDQARAAISGRSLTETAAREHFARLRTILENAQNDIRADVAKLSTAVQGQIRDILASNLVDAERLANEIYALLRAAATFAVDWTAVEGKVNQVESSVASAVQQVNAAAKRDNPTVGADIERKLQVRALEARAVLDQARAAISGRSLTETAAREHFARLRTILENAQNDIRADVAKLSTAVQGQIRDILASNLVDAERLANEIYALLRAAATFAVDWTAVEAKVNQVESSVQSAVQQVNAAAKRDNPTVGADIERKLQVRALEARAVLDQARAAISGRSLTETAAREHFARLRTILENAQNDIRADVAKLSTAVQGQIRDILASNLVDAERLANEIYALLRA